MLDLFRRRDSALRYVLMGLLSLIAISMVVTLIPGFGSGGMSTGDQNIAEIDGQPLTIREVSAQVEQQLRSSGLPRENGYALANQTVNNMIQQRSVEYLAAKMGFKITDADLVEGIKIVLPQLFQDGKFLGKEIYGAFLAQRGMSIPEFESRLRTQLLISKIGDLIDEGVIISPNDIEAEYHRQQDKIKIEYVAVRYQDIAKQTTVTAEDVRAEYEKNKAAHMVPEKRSAIVFVLDEAKIAASFQPTENDLRRAYNDQIDRFRNPERLKVRHILIKTSEKPESEVPKLQAKADDILKQLKGGADFAKLAKENSEDPGSAVNGGELGFIVKGQTVKNFEDTAWSLKPGELSGVIKTEYGFHILQLQEKEDARVRPFEEVKAELANEVGRQLIFDRMQSSMDNLRADLVKSPANLDEVAAKHQAQVVRTPLLPANDVNFPGVGSVPELSAQLFGLNKGDVTSIIQASQDKLAVAVLNEIEPSRQASLEEVSNSIRSSLLARRVSDAVKSKAQEVWTKAKESGADFKKLAADYKLEYKNVPEFGRDGAAEGLGPGVLLGEAFGKSTGYVPSVIEMNDNAYIARVVQAIPADPAKLPEFRPVLISQIRQQRARERAELFQENLVKSLEKSGKIKMNQQALQRFLATFNAS